jgi:hypothetical protein
MAIDIAKALAEFTLLAIFLCTLLFWAGVAVGGV